MYKPTYYSKIYRTFLSLDEMAFQELIHFFEENEKEIRELDFEEYFEVLAAYVTALFEVGAYREHLLMVDVVIETSIINNIVEYKGEDLFSADVVPQSGILVPYWPVSKSGARIGRVIANGS